MNAIEIAVDIDLEQCCGVISRPARCQGFNALKAQLAKLEFIDKDIDYSNRIGLGNIIIEAFWQQSSLSSAFASYETLHLNVPTQNMLKAYTKWRFYTIWAVSGHFYCTVQAQLDQAPPVSSILNRYTLFFALFPFEWQAAAVQRYQEDGGRALFAAQLGKRIQVARLHRLRYLADVPTTALCATFACVRSAICR